MLKNIILWGCRILIGSPAGCRPIPGAPKGRARVGVPSQLLGGYPMSPKQCTAWSARHALGPFIAGGGSGVRP